MTCSQIFSNLFMLGLWDLVRWMFINVKTSLCCEFMHKWVWQLWQPFVCHHFEVKTTFHTINLVKSSSLAELVSLSFYSLGQLKLAGEALLIEIMPFPLIWTYGNYNLIEIQATHTFYKTVSALYVGKVISIRSEYKSVYLLMNKLSTALPWIGFI